MNKSKSKQKIEYNSNSSLESILSSDSRSYSTDSRSYSVDSEDNNFTIDLLYLPLHHQIRKEEFFKVRKSSLFHPIENNKKEDAIAIKK